MDINNKVISEDSLHMFARLANLSYKDGVYYTIDNVESTIVITNEVKISTLKDICEQLRNVIGHINIIGYAIDGLNIISNCKSLNLKQLDTNKMTDMTCMIMCKNIKTLDVSSFNTSNVKTMASMFKDCESLEELDLSNFDTSKVVDISYMFNNCKRLKRLNISSFDTERIYLMWGIFANCESLGELDLNNFNTSAVLDMSYMFYNCKQLKRLNISSFDTSHTEYMQNMFYNCRHLMDLNLQNFSTQRVVNMNKLFYNAQINNLDLSTFHAGVNTTIEDLFSNSEIKTLILPNHLCKSIYDFKDCKITTLILDENNVLVDDLLLCNTIDAIKYREEQITYEDYTNHSAVY